MKQRSFLRLALPGLLWIGMTGCSTIKSWFPDKERDYQFTAEIPELIVPEDLKAGGLAMPMLSPTASTRTETTQVTETVTASDNEPVESPEAASETENEAKAAETAPTSTSMGSSLQIDQPKNQAARIVARAMSRQRLEIIERNIDKGYFYLKYDPDAVQAKDESILDELNFMFGDDPSQELEYRVSLQEINPQLTEVTIQDSEGRTLSNAPANALLKLITDAINNDIPKDEAIVEQPENKDAGVTETEAAPQEAKPAEQSGASETEAKPVEQPENAPADGKPAETAENPDQEGKVPPEQ